MKASTMTIHITLQIPALQCILSRNHETKHQNGEQMLFKWLAMSHVVNALLVLEIREEWQDCFGLIGRK